MKRRNTKAARTMTLVDYTTSPAATFELPLDEIRKRLRPGMFAKVVFKVEGRSSERMWVKITEATDGQYTGTLANDPFVIGDILHHGDAVAFSWNHIINCEEAQS